MANRITLQFPTPQDFTKFRSLVAGKVFGVSIADLTITCECNDREVAQAMNYMGAKVIGEEAG